MTTLSTTPTTLIVGTILLFILLLVLKLFHPERSVARPIPFGPRGHWLLGNVANIDGNLCKVLFAWRLTHGPIFQFHLLPFARPLFAVINDARLARQMLQDRHLAGRPTARGPTTVFLNPTLEGIFSQPWSPTWKELQRFVTTTLSAMGFGRTRMEDRVVAEADALVDAVLATNGAAFDPTSLFRDAVANVVAGIVFGERAEIGRAWSFRDRMKIFFQGFFYLIVHPVYNLAPSFGRIFPTKTLREILRARDFSLKYIDDSIEQHRNTLDPEVPRDLIDAILIERLKQPEAAYLSDGNVRQAILDLFFGGTDTTSLTLSWIVAWLLHRPDVRIKLLDEIGSVLGPEGKPTLSELNRFHYLRAFVDEVWRSSSIVDFSIGHSPIQPVSHFAGFDVPQYLPLVANIWGIHHDPSLWDQPFQFRPERFLDGSGRYIKNENLIPFSIGTRRCIGEKLARLETFVFTLRLLQRVEFRSADGRLPEMSGQKSALRAPGHYEVTARVAEWTVSGKNSLQIELG